MEIGREIGIYQKEGEKFIDSIPVINVSKKKLIKIFNIDINDDPDALKMYRLNKTQYLELSEFIPDLRKFDFDDVEMFCESFQS